MTRWTALALSCLACGQDLVIDAARDRHPINPTVYGINFNWQTSSPRLAEAAAAVRSTARRWGGNNTSRYNWKFDVSNIDSDWFFEVLPDAKVNAAKLPAGSSFNAMMDQVRAGGGMMISTMPIMGWLPKARARMCSFSVQKYGAQCKTDPYWSDCGNGQKSDCKTNIQNDPLDANMQVDEQFGADWVKYLLTRYGPGSQGGVAVWSLDNEPIWWSGTHRDIHPTAQDYDETVEKGIRAAKAIKDADPTALVTGPVSAGWESMYFSLKDCNAGWSSRGVNGGSDWQYWNNPIDRKAHDGKAFVPWYLEQFRKYEDQNGVRLLDILDLHAYIAPSGLEFSKRGNETTERLRLTSTRVFWDPNYVARWLPNVDDVTSPDYGKPVAPALVPRMRKWVADFYPGLQTAITEYNWGAMESITGALAQADILGIFGREGLDVGTLWGPNSPLDPAAFAFRIYRNYDGIGGAFGDTSVQVTAPDPDTVSAFAAARSDSALTVLVINKTTATQPARLNFVNFQPASTAQLWRYTEANLASIARLDDIAVKSGVIDTTVPPYSLSLFIVPADPSTLPQPQPSINAVVDSAARSNAPLAPGKEVIIRGSRFGNSPRVLFDGVAAAPVISSSDSELTAVVPYFGATHSVTHLQVESNGVRSDPVELPVTATSPSIFTVAGSGIGQAIASNGDTSNSTDTPALAGSAITIMATGEGVTDPGGVEGRPAGDVMPRPVAACEATIGGLPAAVEECGAIAGLPPGRFQVRVRIDASVAEGASVPVVIRVGGAPSQDGVTIAVKRP